MSSNITTTSPNDTLDEDDEDIFHKQEQIILFILIMILDVICIIGNVTLMVTIYRCRELRTISNCLILNLAVACLLVALLVLPFWAAMTLTQKVTFGNIVCTASAFMTVTLFSESILTLMGIAIDRFIVICHPMKYPYIVTEKKSAIFIIYTWFHSVIFALLPLVEFGKYEFQPFNVTICILDYLPSSYYLLMVLCVTCFPSVLIILISYIQIFRVARNQARRIHHFDSAMLQSQGPSKTSILKPKPGGSTVKKLKRTSSGIQLLKRRLTDTNLWNKASRAIKSSMRQARAFRTVFAIIGCFLACWIPYITAIAYSIYHQMAIPYTLEFVVTYLAFSSSIANPSICIFVNKDFKKGLRKILGVRKKEMLMEAVAAFTTATIGAPFGRKVHNVSRACSVMSITSIANQSTNINPTLAYMEE